MNVLNVDEWGNLGCLYKACQAAITDGGLFTDTGVNLPTHLHSVHSSYLEKLLLLLFL